MLDSRPLSNVELLAGRSLGLVLMAWVPVLIVAVALQTFGVIALMLDWPLGEPVEPYSLVGFVLNALSVFALWCVVVVLLAVLVRNRAVVVLAALVLLGLNFWSVFRMPLYLQPVLGTLTTFRMASDLVPSLGTGAGVLQRVALWILTAGLLALAAAFHPRPDEGSKSRRIALGAGLVALAGLMIGTLTWQATEGIDRRAAWFAAHQERRNDPRADVQAVSGTVRIEPGRQLELDLEIRVQAPPDQQLDTLLFTLNPGLTVER